MKFPRLQNLPAPLLLFLVSLLAYGLLIPFTGFYWDDWPFAWIAHFLGPREFFPAFAPFRPFLGPFFYATTNLLPATPFIWQGFGVLVRFLTGLSAWFALSGVWPDRKRATLTASLLFLVFPGYSQQWVALTHVNQELIPLIFYLLSFGLTARALRSQNRFVPLTLGALALQVCGLFPTEYFFGLEVFRFFFIWVIVSETAQGFRPRLTRALKRLWPYLLVWAADAAWLLYYYKFGAYHSYDVTLGENPSTTAATLSGLLQALAEAVYKAGFLSWTLIAGQMARVFPGASAWLALGLIAATFSLLIFAYQKINSGYASPLAWIFIGLIGILAGRIPSWAAGLPLTLQSSYDRFMVSMMLGAAMFIAGLLELIRHEKIRTALASLLIALAVGSQFLNGNVFRRDWEGQRALYWEFAWRIPALEPGTIIFTKQMPLDYETDLSMTAPLNWIYAPDYQRGQSLPYVLLYTEKRLGGGSLPDLQPGTSISIPYRTVTFRGSPGQSITVYAPPGGCLRVLDPIYANANLYSRESSSLTGTIALSNPSLIRADAPPPQMPASLFGKEPEHAWCYFYEKAELARQTGDWEKIVSLGGQAEQLGFAPQDMIEWLPFIEAYARLGQWDKAEALAQAAVDADGRVRKGVCQVWGRIRSATGTPPEGQARSEKLLTNFACGK